MGRLHRTATLDLLPATFDGIREELEHLSFGWLEAGARSVVVDHGGHHYRVAGPPVSTSTSLSSWNSGLIEATLEAFDPAAKLMIVGVDSVAAQSRLAAEAHLLNRLAAARSLLSDTTAALVEANDQAMAWHRLATSSTTSLGIADIVHTIAEEARRLTGAPAIAISVPDSPLTVSGDHDLGRAMADIVASEAITEPAVLRRQSNGLTHDVLVTPIGHDQPGLLLVAGPAAGRLHTPTRKLAAAVAGHLGGLMRLAWSHQKELADAKLRNEVEAASFLAAQVLPRRSPVVPGLDLYARNQPARLASGDYFTWTTTDDGLVFAVGDVSGKGLPAALVMTMLSTATTAAAYRDRSGNPARILAEISADVYDYLSDSGVFVTTAVGLWKPESGIVSLVNAGHSPVLLASRGRVEPIPPHVPPLGVLADVDTEASSFELEAGDVLLIGSDGLIEQEDGDGVPFGQDRLACVLGGSTATSARRLVDELFALLETHGGHRPQQDDRTVLALRRTGDGH